MEVLNSQILGNQGPPIMILHGLFGMLDNWRSIGNQLSEKYTVHLIDLRNHGRSIQSDEINYPMMSLDLVHYMEAHQLENAYLLGHSMGGKVAMHFAINYDKKVNKLIIADIAPKPYPPHHNGIFKALNAVPLSQIKSRKEAEDFLSAYIQEPMVVQFLLKNLYREGENYAWRFNLSSLYKNYESLITMENLSGTFDKPTLFLKGENSGYIEQEDLYEIQQHFPKAKIEVVHDAGHWLHAENPQEFLMDLEAFLQSP